MSKELLQSIRLHRETKCQAQEKTGSFKERNAQSLLKKNLQRKSVQSKKLKEM